MNRVRVAIIGWDNRDIKPFTPGQPWEESRFDIFFEEEINLESFWHVLVTVGPRYANVLGGAAPDMRRRWLHYDEAPDPELLGVDIMTTFTRNACAPEGDFQFENAPLVSVVTPTHRPGVLTRPLQSLKSQSYKNWEWIIYINDGTGFQPLPKEVLDFHATDPQRVVVVNDLHVPPTVGAVKRRAFGLARGQILLELDHDDALTPPALQNLVDAAAAFPQCGFFYSDCVEVNEADPTEGLRYGDGWGLGYGSYRNESVRFPLGSNGGEFIKTFSNVTNYPPINNTTLSHIVGVPNHFRAWRRAAYHAAGAHSPDLFVADDYELLLRTFLTTEMCHVNKLGYIQYMNGANTQDARRPEIQRLVRWVWNHYAEDVRRRCADLVKDGRDPEHLEHNWVP